MAESGNAQSTLFARTDFGSLHLNSQMRSNIGFLETGSKESDLIRVFFHGEILFRKA